MKTINKNSGIVFIPDISGFSSFVKKTDDKTGALIIEQLLNTIVAANQLSLQLSEFEGDAILFYRYGKAFSIPVILEQYEVMLHAFNTKISELSQIYPATPCMSLKLVVHYGNLELISVTGLHKLYGEAIVEAHRLLKNSIGGNTYALITDAYLDAAEKANFEVGQMGKLCEIFNGVGKLCYTYFPYPFRTQVKK